MNDLPLLRDIHLPDEGISFFPPAIGWWLIVLFLVSVVFIYKIVGWLRRTSAKLYARHLLQPLKRGHDIKSAVKMSEILRRICIRKYPEAVAYFGDEWINFLLKKSHKTLSSQTADLLKNAPFMPEDSNNYTAKDVDDLWLFCYEWIGENL